MRKYKSDKKIFPMLLVGNWTVTTMKRQARMEEEALTNVPLQFKSDATFSGKGGCNNIRGSYVLKGSSIKFSNIIIHQNGLLSIGTGNSFSAIAGRYC